MIRVGGKPILEHQIDLLRQHGITGIAINLHHHPAVIMGYFDNGERWGVKITYSYRDGL